MKGTRVVLVVGFVILCAAVKPLLDVLCKLRVAAATLPLVGFGFARFSVTFVRAYVCV